MFLQELGLEYEIILANKAEPKPYAEEEPTDYAKRASLCKAKQAQSALPNHEQPYVLIAADTVVSVQGKILGKPKDLADAVTMLKLLAGKEHEVISAVTIMAKSLNYDLKTICFFDSTKVLFHTWSDEILTAYANSGECFDKAGAYAIQGQGAFLVKSIIGSWSTVVGLPVSELVQILLEQGFISASQT